MRKKSLKAAMIGNKQERNFFIDFIVITCN